MTKKKMNISSRGARLRIAFAVLTLLLAAMLACLEGVSIDVETSSHTVETTHQEWVDDTGQRHSQDRLLLDDRPILSEHGPIK